MGLCDLTVIVWEPFSKDTSTIPTLAFAKWVSTGDVQHLMLISAVPERTANPLKCVFAYSYQKWRPHKRGEGSKNVSASHWETVCRPRCLPTSNRSGETRRTGGLAVGMRFLFAAL